MNNGIGFERWKIFQYFFELSKSASFFATTFHTSQIWRIAKTLVSQNKSMQPFSTLNSCSRMKNISSVGEIMLILKWSYFSCQFFSPAWSEYFLSLVHFLHLKVLNQLVQIIFFFFSFLKVFSQSLFTLEHVVWDNNKAQFIILC